MPHINEQSITEIVKSMNPEQRVLWNEIFLRFGERCTIVPFYFTGSATGLSSTPYGTYRARTIYYCLSLIVGTTVEEGNGGYMLFYDENNASTFPAYNHAFMGDVERHFNLMEVKTIYFSRVLGLNFTANAKVRIVGFRITY